MHNVDAGTWKDTKIYAIPYSQNVIGVIDTTDDTFTTIATSLTETYKYSSGVAVETKVYALPYSQDDIGVIDTTDDTFTTPLIKRFIIESSFSPK